MGQASSTSLCEALRGSPGAEFKLQIPEFFQELPISCLNKLCSTVRGLRGGTFRLAKWELLQIFGTDRIIEINEFFNVLVPRGKPDLLTGGPDLAGDETFNYKSYSQLLTRHDDDANGKRKGSFDVHDQESFAPPGLTTSISGLEMAVVVVLVNIELNVEGKAKLLCSLVDWGDQSDLAADDVILLLNLIVEGLKKVLKRKPTMETFDANQKLSEYGSRTHEKETQESAVLDLIATSEIESGVRGLFGSSKVQSRKTFENITTWISEEPTLFKVLHASCRRKPKEEGLPFQHDSVKGSSEGSKSDTGSSHMSHDKPVHHHRTGSRPHFEVHGAANNLVQSREKSRSLSRKDSWKSKNTNEFAGPNETTPDQFYKMRKNRDGNKHQISISPSFRGKIQIHFSRLSGFALRVMVHQAKVLKMLENRVLKTIQVGRSLEKVEFIHSLSNSFLRAKWHELLSYEGFLSATMEKHKGSLVGPPSFLLAQLIPALRDLLLSSQQDKEGVRRFRQVALNKVFKGLDCNIFEEMGLDTLKWGTFYFEGADQSEALKCCENHLVSAISSLEGSFLPAEMKTITEREKSGVPRVSGVEPQSRFRVASSHGPEKAVDAVDQLKEFIDVLITQRTAMLKDLFVLERDMAHLKSLDLKKSQLDGSIMFLSFLLTPSHGAVLNALDPKFLETVKQRLVTQNAELLHKINTLKQDHELAYRTALAFVQGSALAVSILGAFVDYWRPRVDLEYQVQSSSKKKPKNKKEEGCIRGGTFSSYSDVESGLSALVRGLREKRPALGTSFLIVQSLEASLSLLRRHESFLQGALSIVHLSLKGTTREMLEAPLETFFGELNAVECFLQPERYFNTSFNELFACVKNPDLKAILSSKVVETASIERMSLYEASSESFGFGPDAGFRVHPVKLIQKIFEELENVCLEKSESNHLSSQEGNGRKDMNAEDSAKEFPGTQVTEIKIEPREKCSRERQARLREKVERNKKACDSKDHSHIFKNPELRFACLFQVQCSSKKLEKINEIIMNTCSSDALGQQLTLKKRLYFLVRNFHNLLSSPERLKDYSALGDIVSTHSQFDLSLKSRVAAFQASLEVHFENTKHKDAIAGFSESFISRLKLLKELNSLETTENVLVLEKALDEDTSSEDVDYLKEMSHNFTRKEDHPVGGAKPNRQLLVLKEFFSDCFFLDMEKFFEDRLTFLDAQLKKVNHKSDILEATSISTDDLKRLYSDTSGLARSFRAFSASSFRGAKMLNPPCSVHAPQSHLISVDKKKNPDKGEKQQLRFRRSATGNMEGSRPSKKEVEEDPGCISPVFPLSPVSGDVGVPTGKKELREKNEGVQKSKASKLLVAPSFLDWTGSWKERSMITQFVCRRSTEVSEEAFGKSEMTKVIAPLIRYLAFSNNRSEHRYWFYKALLVDFFEADEITLASRFFHLKEISVTGALRPIIENRMLRNNFFSSVFRTDQPAGGVHNLIEQTNPEVQWLKRAEQGLKFCFRSFTSTCSDEVGLMSREELTKYEAEISSLKNELVNQSEYQYFEEVMIPILLPSLKPVTALTKPEFSDISLRDIREFFRKTIADNPKFVFSALSKKSLSELILSPGRFSTTQQTKPLCQLLNENVALEGAASAIATLSEFIAINSRTAM